METGIKTSFTEQFAAQLEAALPVSAQRQQAWAEFKRLGFPSTKAEEYKFTPIARQLEKVSDWTYAAPSSAQAKALADFAIPEITGQKLVLVNGRLDLSLSTLASTPGLTVTSLSAENPAALGTLNSFSKDAFSALNTAAWTDGVYIRVAAGTVVADPITILHVQDATSGPVQVHTRFFAHVEKGAEVTVIHQTHTLGAHKAFHTVVDEVHVESGARFNYYKLQNDAGKSLEVWNSTIQQADDSHVDTFTLTTSGEIVRNNFQIEINGERCESHFHGLYLLGGETLADNHTVVDHQKPNSFSNELYKGIMDEKSKGVFNGKIFVRPYAQKTNAYQSNRNILLTETASVNTKPQLEIWADDVKCSHGCTSGQLDEEALFYLRSRGLAHDTARAMLLYAFAAETLETIKNEKLKSYIENLVGNRLHRNF
jgi:Fe-S cluster assembly protein SufD